jgi:hypothetical protein
MRVIFIFVAPLLVITGWFGRNTPAHAKCLSSANAVWAAHPGAHAIWRLRIPGHEGVKCWFARGSGIEDYAGRGSSRESDVLNAIPLPPARPNFQNDQADIDQAPLLAFPAGEARSILIWGRPMEVDATWDELFAAREHHAK